MRSFGNSGNQNVILPSGKKIIIHAVGKIYYRQSDPGMMLQYSTYLDLNNTSLLQSEINEIWLLFEKQFNDSGLNTAVISANSPPADKPFFIGVQQTRHFVFEKKEGGFWEQIKPELKKTQIQEYQVNFGKIEERNGISMVFETSRSLPLLTKNTGFRFGLTIFPPNNNPYNFYCLFFPPKSVSMSNDTGEIFTEILDSQDSLAGFRLPTRRTAGITTMPMWFDPGDPAGEYRIELYIDDAAISSIDFLVSEQ